MPIIYLSPSTQENNLYVNGGTEEEWMNRLADAMEPYLTASGIRYSRNTPDMTAASSIRASNAGNYDLHLALHSNAAPEGQYGQIRGILVFYYPGSVQGQRAATLVADGLAVARNIVLSLTEYFGVPFLEPRPSRPAVVDVSWGYLNIRDKPDTSSPVLARAYDGARLTVLNQWQNWYVVRFDSVVGWANADFITLL